MRVNESAIVRENRDLKRRIEAARAELVVLDWRHRDKPDHSCSECHRLERIAAALADPETTP